MPNYAIAMCDMYGVWSVAVAGVDSDGGAAAATAARRQQRQRRSMATVAASAAAGQAGTVGGRCWLGTAWCLVGWWGRHDTRAQIDLNLNLFLRAHVTAHGIIA